MFRRLQEADDDRSVENECSGKEKQKRKMELLDEQYETPEKIAKFYPVSTSVLPAMEHLSSSLIKEPDSEEVEHLSSSLNTEEPDSEAVEHLSSSMIKTSGSEEVEHLSFSLIERELPPIVTQTVQDGALSSLKEKEGKAFETQNQLQNNCPVSKLASQNISKENSSSSGLFDLLENKHQDTALSMQNPLLNNRQLNQLGRKYEQRKFSSASGHVDLLENDDAPQNLLQNTAPVNELASQSFIKESSFDSDCSLQESFVECNSLKSIQSDIKREIIPSSHVSSLSDGFCNLREPLMNCSGPKSLQDDIGKEITRELGEEQALIFLQKFRAFLKQDNDPLDSMLGAVNAMKTENMPICQAGKPKDVQPSPSSKPANSIPSEVPMSGHIDPEMFEVGVGKELVNSIGETRAIQFVLKVAEYHATNREFFACIQNAATSVNLKDKLILSYLSQNFCKTKKFLCKLRLNGCTIASGDGSKKKKAKNACMRNAFGVLMHLASGSSKKSIENVILSQKPSQLSLPDDDFVELYRLHLFITKQKFAVSSALSNAVSALKLDKVVRIHNDHFTTKIPNNKPVQINTWTFTYKEILIAFGVDKSAKKARNKGVASAFSKLRNLVRCKIENKEVIDTTDASYQSYHLLMKDISDGNVAIVTGHDSVKPLASKQELLQSHLPNSLVERHGLADSFALNRELLQSSFRDSFVLTYYPGRSNTGRSILPQSASFCSQAFGYSVCNLSEANPFKLVRIYRVDVLINQISVGTGLAHSQEEAKSEACKNALELLRKNYYVIQIKPNYEQNCKVIREQVFSSTATSQALPESNIGCKMLRNMGWTGGGLGKCGIVEPISVEATPNNKRGLGFGGQNLEETEFKKKISSMLKDLSKSNSVSDLVFASDFSSAERKEISRIANGCNLHSSRHGKGFLIVRRKYCVQELLNYLVHNGGSDEKFRLVDASRDAEKLFSSI